MKYAGSWAASGFSSASATGASHSEAFTDFAIADTARELLWNRIQTLASNHGILRVWTTEKTLFWRRSGY